MIEKYRQRPDCPVEVTMQFRGDKWKMLIIAYLMLETNRFMELKNNIGTISQKVLTKNLRELEEDGLVQQQTTIQTGIDCTA